MEMLTACVNVHLCTVEPVLAPLGPVVVSLEPVLAPLGPVVAPLGPVLAPLAPVLPVVAPLGTDVWISEPETTVNVVAVPLNVTPDAPVRLLPKMVTFDPTLP